MKPLTIVRLVVKDFKRISAVAIEPKSAGLVHVRGRNAQGKSSVLDAFETAICGKRVAPPQPVRAGADRAEILVDLGAIQIRRRFTASGGMTLKVESKDPNQPQTQGALDALYAQTSVDPGAFIRLTPREQAEKLRQAMGIDTVALDAARQDTFDERTLVGRELARLEGAFAQMPFPEGPDQSVDVGVLLRELERAEKTQADADEALRLCDQVREEQKDVDRQIADLKRLLAEAESRRSALNAEAERAHREREIYNERLIDPVPIKEQIAAASTTNEIARARRERMTTARALEAKREEHERLTRDIAGIDAEKERMLAEARFPIKGVALQGDQVTLNHVPIEQASQAERLRFATALAIALKPDMPVILIRDGSLLDEESMRTLEAMAVEAGAQIWIEEVGTEAGDNSILIEDGAVVEQGVAS